MDTITNYLTRGLESSLDKTPIEDGKLRYTVDTGKCFLDYVGEDNIPVRIRISDIVFGNTEVEIKAIVNPMQKLYISSDTAKVFYNINGSWKEVNALKLVENSDNSNKVLWFSSTEDSSPMYNTDLAYNPSTNTLSVSNIVVANSIKIGNMMITETVTEEMDHIVDFVIV